MFGGGKLANKGKLVISLDLELNWGVFDVYSTEYYRGNLLGAREIVPILLEKFQSQHIHATWGIVGFLFFSNKQDLLKEIPKVQPQYKDLSISSYEQIKHIGNNELEDPIHFGSGIIEQIQDTPYQEIATHTFSHYYTLAKGQCQAEFQADLEKALEIAERKGISVKTIIFPRNQLNAEYLTESRQFGLIAYRGCENHWLYRIHGEREGLFKRLIRLLDSYVNISGNHVYTTDALQSPFGLVNIPSSKFLRPYSRRLRLLEPLKLRRIMVGMTEAAKEGKVFHLWWHPHNFGARQRESIQQLDILLNHFQLLRERYGMESYSMKELGEMVLNDTKCGVSSGSIYKEA